MESLALSIGCFGVGFLACALRIGVQASLDRRESRDRCLEAIALIREMQAKCRDLERDLAIVVGQRVARRIEPRIKRVEAAVAHVKEWTYTPERGLRLLDEASIETLRGEADAWN